MMESRTTPSMSSRASYARGAVLLVLLMLAALLLVGSEFETRTRQREVEALLSAEGGALVEARGHAAEHAWRAQRELEDQISSSRGASPGPKVRIRPMPRFLDDSSGGW